LKLKTKVILFFLALGLLSGSLIMGLAWSAVNSVVMKNLASVALDKSTGLVDRAQNGFSAKSETLLLPLLQLVQKQGRDALYVAAVDPERTFKEWLCLAILAGVRIKLAQSVEAVCGRGMISAEHFLAEAQGLSGRRNRLRILAGLRKFLYLPIEFICLGRMGRWRRCTRR